MSPSTSAVESQEATGQWKAKAFRYGSALGMAAALLVFIVLATFAATRDTTPGDVWLTRQLQSINSDVFARPLDDTEDLAQNPLLLYVMLAGTVAATVLGGLRAGIFAALLPIVRFVVPTLKDIFERPRPSASLVEVYNQPGDPSFPSGHAFSAVLVYGMFFYLAALYIPVRWARWAVQGACLWVIVVTCVERAYVGHHWPSDVLGGALLAGIVLSGAIWAHRRTLAPAESEEAAAVQPALASAAERG